MEYSYMKSHAYALCIAFLVNNCFGMEQQQQEKISLATEIPLKSQNEQEEKITLLVTPKEAEVIKKILKKEERHKIEKQKN